MQEKEVYITPEVEIIEFECEDIITTSDGVHNVMESQGFVE